MQDLIYFGEVPEPLKDLDGLDFTANDTTWYFKMEVNRADAFVRLYDTCNRVLPVDIESIDALISALEVARDLINSTVPVIFTVDSSGFMEEVK